MSVSHLIVLQATNLAFEYQGRLHLSIPSFELRQGTIAIIIGPNSSGKSTLCKLLASVLDPSEGQLDTSAGATPVLVWQEGELFPGTVRKNIRLVAKQKSLVQDLAKRLRLEQRLNQDCATLSGGVKQRVAIARALAIVNRKVIILDEPTRSLDPNAVEEIAGLIVRVHTEKPDGATIVVTHDKHLVTLLDRLKPVFYTLEPVGRASTYQRSTKAVLKGPYPSPTFFLRPPTPFTAEFFGYENIFALNDPRKEIKLANLLPLEVPPKPGLEFCIINPAAIKIGDANTGAGEMAQIAAIEYRPGGVRLIRFAWRDVDLLALDRRKQIDGKPPSPERRKLAAGQVSFTIDVHQCLRQVLKE